MRALGDNIDLVGTGTPCVVTGRVVSVDGTPLPGATLDVWQANDQGFYDVQQPGVQPRTNGRGLFTADENGRVLVPHDRAELLPDPDRRPGRRVARGDRQARVPPGAHSLHRDRSRPPRPDHAHLRGGQRVHRVGHGLRGKEVPGGRLRRGRRTRANLASSDGRTVEVPFRHADFDIIMQPGSSPPRTAGASKSPSVIDFAVNAVSPLAHFPSAKAMSASGPGESSATCAASTFAVSACSWMAARRTSCPAVTCARRFDVDPQPA